MSTPESAVEFEGALITPKSATPLERVVSEPTQQSLVDLVKSAAINERQSLVAQSKVENKSNRGDDLIKAADKFNTLSDEEASFLRLFAQSKLILDSRIAEDESFGAKVADKASKLKGMELATYIINEADNIKIETLKQVDPKFTSQNAALVGLTDDITFGQLSRLSAAAESLVSDKQYHALLEEKAEEYRLLEKAYPAANIGGRVASFFVPNSPVAKLFNLGRMAANVGKAGKAAQIFGKVVRNPSLLQNVTARGVQGGVGAAALGAVRGVLGTGEQDTFNLERGALEAGAAGVLGLGLGASVQSAGAGVNALRKATQPAVKNIAKSVDTFWTNTFASMTGLPSSVLKQSVKERATGTTRSVLSMRGQANRQDEIGDEFVDFLQSQKSKLPEVQQAETVLPFLGNINLKLITNAMRRAASSKNVSPSQQNEAKALLDWANWADAQVENAFKAPADLVRKRVLDKIQAELDTEFGKSSSFFAANLKNAGRYTRLLIENNANQIANSGSKDAGAASLYVQLMRKAAEKRGLLKYMNNALGKTEEKQREKAERLIKNLFGPNKTFVQAKLRKLDENFGTNFLERARLADLAKRTGTETGELGLFPNIPTGGFLRPIAAGAASGFVADALGPELGIGLTAVGAATGAALSSPIIASRLVGTSSSISGFARRLFANPEALRQLGKSRLVSEEVRGLAQRLYQTLQNDGPISARGSLRLIADTPFFVGLVSGFDDIEQALSERSSNEALIKLKQNRKPTGE